MKKSYSQIVSGDQKEASAMSSAASGVSPSVHLSPNVSAEDPIENSLNVTAKNPLPTQSETPAANSAVAVTDPPAADSAIAVTDPPAANSAVAVTDPPAADLAVAVTDPPAVDSAVVVTDAPDAESSGNNSAEDSGNGTARRPTIDFRQPHRHYQQSRNSGGSGPSGFMIHGVLFSPYSGNPFVVGNSRPGNVRTHPYRSHISGGDMACYRCRQGGHKAANCPNGGD